MEQSRPPGGKVPGAFKAFVSRFPELAESHERIARAVDALGPLDARTCHLIKMGMAIGAGMESAVRSHVRQASQHGATEQEIEQAIMLAMNTLGFPRTVAAWSWARVQFERDAAERDATERGDAAQNGAAN